MRRGPLLFRFHRDWDIGTPEAAGCIILRVFSPVKDIRPDHRYLILRCEFHDGGMRTMYTGSVHFDAPQVEFTDAMKLYVALGEAKNSLAELQMRWNVKHQQEQALLEGLRSRIESPEDVAHLLAELPNLRSESELLAAETELAAFIKEPVEVAVEPPQEPLESVVVPAGDNPQELFEQFLEFLRTRNPSSQCG